MGAVISMMGAMTSTAGGGAMVGAVSTDGGAGWICAASLRCGGKLTTNTVVA